VEHSSVWDTPVLPRSCQDVIDGVTLSSPPPPQMHLDAPGNSRTAANARRLTRLIFRDLAAVCVRSSFVSSATDLTELEPVSIGSDILD
jgi:hypothetical protein